MAHLRLYAVAVWNRIGSTDHDRYWDLRMNKQRKQDIKEVMERIMELQNQMADESAKLVERQARAAYCP